MVRFDLFSGSYTPFINAYIVIMCNVGAWGIISFIEIIWKFKTQILPFIIITDTTNNKVHVPGSYI